MTENRQAFEGPMRIDTPRHSENAFRVDLLFNFMDLAIACCKSATLDHDQNAPETVLAGAKKSYGKALRFAGRLSFNAQQVAEFEGRSVRLEMLISRLQTQKGAAMVAEPSFR